MTLSSATQIRADILDGQRTSVDVVCETLSRIERTDPKIHAMLTVCAEHALDQAHSLDQRLAGGEKPGPLWGVPFTVKDTYDTAGVRTTYGSRVYADHVPDRDAELVARIRRAGGVLVGKTNSPEFAVYIRTVNDLMPESRNPWDLSRTTGGSSGGAAASVAAGMVPLAVGSDGGGSVRIPAALCGVVGLLPSRGSIPRGGGNIGTRRFSAAGPIARDAADSLLLWRVMQGPSDSDGLSRGLLPTGVKSERLSLPKRLRWLEDSGVEGAECDVIAACRGAAHRLAEILDVPCEESELTMEAPRFSDAFYAMMQADRLSTGGRALLEDPRTNRLLTGYARHHFEQATKVLGAEYSAAVETQLAATEHVLALLEGVDVLATPTLGFVAPSIPGGPESLPEDARRGFVAFTFLLNYTGFPAVTVPCALVRGLPVGLQLVGRPGSEEMLLAAAQRFSAEGFRIPCYPFESFVQDDLQEVR